MNNSKIIVINLKKRNDRKNNIINIFNNVNINNYTFYEAIDGKELKLTLEIKNLFAKNDFGARKGFIGCALSHYSLWIELIKDKKNDFYIIFEDDIQLGPNFNEHFKKSIDYTNENKNEFDVLFLGYHKHTNDTVEDNINNTLNKDFMIIPFSNHLYTIGGLFSYIITKNGVKNMLNYIENNGIQHGIDYLFKINNDLKMYLLEYDIVFSDWVRTNDNRNIDSNIQKDVDSFDLNEIMDYDDLNEINKIQIISDMSDSETLSKKWSKLSKNNGKWNNIQLTGHSENIDYYIILNSSFNNSNYNPNKTIIFQMEPYCNNEYQKWGVKTWGVWENPDSAIFLEVRNHKNYYNNCEWLLKETYTELSEMTIIKEKDYLSTIVSSKYIDPGHIKRIDFLKYIEIMEPEFKIDIYGNENTFNFKNYVKQLSDSEKSTGIIPYKYYFILENNFEKNYISEKFWEPLLCESLVFYCGAPNISEYINPNAYVQLNMDDFENSLMIIKNAIKNDLWSEKIDCIRKEKYKILNYYNFFPTVERIITKDIWKNNLFLLNKNTKIFILKLETNNYIHVKMELLIKILREFEFNIEIINFCYNKIITENILNDDNTISDYKKLIFNDTEIKYAKNENNINYIFNKIKLYENILEYESDYDNFLILDENAELINSLNYLFCHIKYLPQNYDYIQLYESINNPFKIINQNNSLYYEVKKYNFETKLAHLISKNGIRKLLNYNKNFINNDFVYDCYNDSNNFNFYISKNNQLFNKFF